MQRWKFGLHSNPYNNLYHKLYSRQRHQYPLCNLASRSGSKLGSRHLRPPCSNPSMVLILIVVGRAGIVDMAITDQAEMEHGVTARRITVHGIVVHGTADHGVTAAVASTCHGGITALALTHGTAAGEAMTGVTAGTLARHGIITAPLSICPGEIITRASARGAAAGSRNQPSDVSS